MQHLEDELKAVYLPLSPRLVLVGTTDPNWGTVQLARPHRSAETDPEAPGRQAIQSDRQIQECRPVGAAVDRRTCAGADQLWRA